ncbi:MAG: hypothetical protein ACYCPT_13030 [Acidimicrobiales bacterium]
MSVSGTGEVFQAPQTANGTAVESAANGGFLFPTTPNLVDFLTFLANSVQIPSTALPTSSPWPGYALNQAIGLVLQPPLIPVPVMYCLACYNCATHILFVITPDQPGINYFSNARSSSSTGFRLIQPSSGLVLSTSDETTSTTNIAPKWAAGLTAGQLDFYKTPWGREYLSWNQSYGPSIVGLT